MCDHLKGVFFEYGDTRIIRESELKQLYEDQSAASIGFNFHLFSYCPDCGEKNS